MLVTIYEKDSGIPLRVESVDAKECVASGFYVYDAPTPQPAPLPVIGGQKKAKGQPAL
jgi:hypothetical protein